MEIQMEAQVSTWNHSSAVICAEAATHRISARPNRFNKGPKLSRDGRKRQKQLSELHRILSVATSIVESILVLSASPLASSPTYWRDLANSFHERVVTMKGEYRELVAAHPARFRQQIRRATNRARRVLKAISRHSEACLEESVGEYLRDGEEWQEPEFLDDPQDTQEPEEDESL